VDNPQGYPHYHNVYPPDLTSALVMASGGECLDGLEMLRTDGILRKLFGAREVSGSHDCGTDAQAQPRAELNGRADLSEDLYDGLSPAAGHAPKKALKIEVFSTHPSVQLREICSPAAHLSKTGAKIPPTVP
jgi:hypothetical protein